MSKTRGIVVFAQNNEQENYVNQACLLAMSLKVTNPDEKISIVTDDQVPKEYQELFDKTIPIPYGDDAKESSWKIENRWKIYHATPYDRTIVLDTDMLVLQDISTWWNFLSNYELFFTSKVYTYRAEIVIDDYYRKAFTENQLPNLYAGLHYFEKSEFAQEFYKWMELITQNWELFYGQYVKSHYPKGPSMDLTASITAKILDCENLITNSIAKFPSFTHMKPRVQNWNKVIERWQDYVRVYIDRDCNIQIGSYNQNGILHYTEKDFANQKIFERYRNLLNV